MQIETTRFGVTDYNESDVLNFPNGMIGMEAHHRWVLLADAENRALAWLQALDRPDLALAVVAPRLFVPDYQVRVAARDVADLKTEAAPELQVLAVLNRHDEGLTLNLKAPVLISLESRRARQVVAKDDHAVQYLLGATIPFRRSA